MCMVLRSGDAVVILDVWLRGNVSSDWDFDELVVSDDEADEEGNASGVVIVGGELEIGMFDKNQKIEFGKCL